MSEFGCVTVDRIEDAPIPVCFQLALRYDQARDILARGDRIHEPELRKPRPIIWDDVHGVATLVYPGVTYTLFERRGVVLESRGGVDVMHREAGHVAFAGIAEGPSAISVMREVCQQRPEPGEREAGLN